MHDEEEYWPSGLHKVARVQPLGDHRLMVCFTNGAVGEWDYAEMVARAGPMLQPLRAPEVFARVAISHGALEWPNGYDQCADKLILDMYRGGALQSDAPAP